MQVFQIALFLYFTTEYALQERTGAMICILDQTRFSMASIRPTFQQLDARF